MIQITRTRTAAGIPAAFRGAKHTENSAKLIALRLAGGEPDSGVWKKAKKQLRTESFDKCAYCESATAVVAHGDVEHFRPKSVYWWLAYCIDNYTYACQICNQVYKSDSFPHSGPDLVGPDPAGLGPNEIAALTADLAPDPLDAAAVALHHRTMAAEKAHLPDPYVLDPEPLFAWRADAVLKEVEIRARTTKVASKRAAAAAITNLGLNRDELKRLRYEHLALAQTFADFLGVAGLPASARTLATDGLRAMMASSAPYAGMVRYFVDVEWNLGIAPP